jgi:hypothetical protein
LILSDGRSQDIESKGADFAFAAELLPPPIFSTLLMSLNSLICSLFNDSVSALCCVPLNIRMVFQK